MFDFVWFGKKCGATPRNGVGRHRLWRNRLVRLKSSGLGLVWGKSPRFRFKGGAASFLTQFSRQKRREEENWVSRSFGRFLKVFGVVGGCPSWFHLSFLFSILCQGECMTVGLQRVRSVELKELWLSLCVFRVGLCVNDALNCVCWCVLLIVVLFCCSSRRSVDLATPSWYRATLSWCRCRSDFGLVLLNWNLSF